MMVKLKERKRESWDSGLTTTRDELENELVGRFQLYAILAQLLVLKRHPFFFDIIYIWVLFFI